jgi:hypothetical protein
LAVSSGAATWNRLGSSIFTSYIIAKVPAEVAEDAGSFANQLQPGVRMAQIYHDRIREQYYST